MLQTILNFLASLAMIVGLSLPVASNAMTTTVFDAGSLIKGSGPAVYYYAENGKRYVFPNSKTYFTWYSDFSGVVQIPDRMLSTIPIGGNVTYRPGVKMVKITTDPRVYIVDSGAVLRHVASEEIAKTLYNLNWNNQIDDVPDAFFTNYTIGNPVDQASDFSPADVMTQITTISKNKRIDETMAVISIGDKLTGFVPTSITVKQGTTVTWKNQDSKEHKVMGTGFQSQNLKYQESYNHTFNHVGDFEYHDDLNTAIQGTIHVR